MDVILFILIDKKVSLVSFVERGFLLIWKSVLLIQLSKDCVNIFKILHSNIG